MIDFGKCKCGGRLVPIWNEWKDGDKTIRGIDVLRCECCLKDCPAPSDYDEVIYDRQRT